MKPSTALHLGLAAVSVGSERALVQSSESNYTVHFSTETYLLPSDFQGNVSKGFDATRTAFNQTLNAQLARADNASFISYSQEFDSIIGDNAVFQLAEQDLTSYKYFEGGAWVAERAEVWFCSSVYNGESFVYVFNVTSGEVRQPDLAGDQFLNPNGAYYFNGLVYYTTWGNNTLPSSIISIDPATGETTTVVNNYFGLRFNSPDDITWVTGYAGATYMYFTDSNYGFTILGHPESLPNSVWRYDPSDKSVVPVVNRADIQIPNGIRVDASQRKMYITDGPIVTSPGVSNGTGTPAIYAYDIADDGFLMNKRLFGQTRAGISDGIKIDDKGRVWTGETEGVVVRSPRGKVLGVFNGGPLLVPGTPYPIAKFALAGDTLVVFALHNLWTLKLAESVVTPGRYSSCRGR